jgi:hypothetical protein
MNHIGRVFASVMRSAIIVTLTCVLQISLLAAQGLAPNSALSVNEDVGELKKQLVTLQVENRAKEELLIARIRASAQNQSQKGAFARAAEKWNKEHGYTEETEIPKPPKEDPCDPQRLFIRADSIDNFLYGITPAAKAKGASISYTNDHVAGKQTISVNGMVSYMLYRNLCVDPPYENGSYISGWAVVPFISGNGDFTQPQAKKEQSSTKIGIETQFEVSRGLASLSDFPLRQVFTLSPYFQTDFRGQASASGLNAYWDLYDARFHLGGYLPSNPYLGWFLQLRGEADLRNVEDPGLTGLSPTSYAWIGGTARLSIFFFPFADNVPENIRNRFSLIAGVNFFHDLRSGMDIHSYTATLKYKLNPEGYSSIGFEYSKGTDKDTLVSADKYMVKLLYAQ